MASVARAASYTETIKALISAGAWLPPDTSWYVSEQMLSRLRHKLLESLLEACSP